ncbi:MAG TPA: L-histidine N(alpha)-methyltransferase [Gammaproteobacteria bacterium]|nr:L-histidine N(alpha)-methyltransferase [Gammaproteobacteria bacterium]
MEEELRLRLNTHRVVPSTPSPGIAGDARAGLLQQPRSMPPKYFYDERGSRLFDAICDTPEYYPTRMEERLLQNHALEIVRRARPDHILEFGSGTARKTRHLFDACELEGWHSAYWPFDVCEAMLEESGRSLLQRYEWLEVNALVGDYLGGLRAMPRPQGNCLYVFLGGTIGNFSERQARAFLAELRALMRPGDRLLLGADRLKDAGVLHAAYNDAAGLTAAFNLNLLRVLNRELDADFRPEAFAHCACFNQDEQQVEMYLVSRHRQRVRLAELGVVLDFAAGERIQTEISRKFTADGLETLLSSAGLAVAHHFEAGDGWFSLLLARPD